MFPIPLNFPMQFILFSTLGLGCQIISQICNARFPSLSRDMITWWWKTSPKEEAWKKTARECSYRKMLMLCCYFYSPHMPPYAPICRNWIVIMLSDDIRWQQYYCELRFIRSIKWWNDHVVPEILSILTTRINAATNKVLLATKNFLAVAKL